jgi:transposase
MHRDAVTAAGAELVRFAKSCGLISGEWIAIDGSKFRAVASIDTVRERLALQRYLDSLEKADEAVRQKLEPKSCERVSVVVVHPRQQLGQILFVNTGEVL